VNALREENYGIETWWLVGTSSSKPYGAVEAVPP